MTSLRDNPLQVFSCKFNKFFQTNFFVENLQPATSVITKHKFFVSGLRVTDYFMDEGRMVREAVTGVVL